MHLELVELLRCPNVHAPGVLVAASNKTVNRYIVDGLLGCPECGAEYTIERGATHFSTHGAGAVDRLSSETQLPDSERAMRIAAQLGMTDGRSVYALVNFPARIALNIRAIVPSRLLLINASESEVLGDPSVTLSEAPAGVVIASDLSPIQTGKLDGVAFGGLTTPSLFEQAVSILKAKGRLVAPASCELPDGVTELVRDDREWIATRDAVATTPIGITRR